MKRNLFWVGLIALVLCLSVTFLTGCAKKAGLKSDTATTQEQKQRSQRGRQGVFGGGSGCRRQGKGAA